MNFIPQNNTVLCKQINETKETANVSGIVYEQENLPLYEIVQMSNDFKLVGFAVGDVVVSDSIPTKIKCNDECLYIIKAEHLAARVV